MMQVNNAEVYEDLDEENMLLQLVSRPLTEADHREQPRLQQQQRNPNSSQRTLTGSAFLRVTLTRVTVALNSSGATLECNEVGNSVSNLLDRPNTVMLPAPLMMIGSGTSWMSGPSRMLATSSAWSSYIASKSAMVFCNFLSRSHSTHSAVTCLLCY